MSRARWYCAAAVLAVAVGCGTATTSAACREAGRPATDAAADGAPSHRDGGEPEAGGQDGGACPGHFVLAPVMYLGSSATAVCDPSSPQVQVWVFLPDGRVIGGGTYSCQPNGWVDIGSFPPGDYRLAVQWKDGFVGAERVRPSDCRDVERPWCRPLVAKVGPCETRYVPAAVECDFVSFDTCL